VCASRLAGSVTACCWMAQLQLCRTNGSGVLRPPPLANARRYAKQIPHVPLGLSTRRAWSACCTIGCSPSTQIQREPTPLSPVVSGGIQPLPLVAARGWLLLNASRVVLRHARYVMLQKAVGATHLCIRSRRMPMNAKSAASGWRNAGCGTLMVRSADCTITCAISTRISRELTIRRPGA